MSREEGEVEYKAFGMNHVLELGDFVVQDNKENRDILKHFVLRGEISLEDFELQCEMEGVEVEQDVYNEIDTGKEITYSAPINSIAAKEDRTAKMQEKMSKINDSIKEEKSIAIAPFECLSNIKRGREEIFSEMVEKGILSLDDLAVANIEVLTSIKHVGIKLAEQMKKQASELVEPKE
jgi:hypothetical protein